MKHPIIKLILLAATVLVPLATHAQTTAFTYQGRFNTNGAPYTGSAEFQFTLWDAASGGSAVATNNPASVIAAVADGLFTTMLDFGSNPFSGQPRFLQIEARTTIGAFTPLAPRQPLTPTPYALRAFHLTTNGLAGTYGNAVTLNNAGNNFAGTLTGVFTGTANGNGSGLTNVNAGKLGGLASSNFWQLGGNAAANPTNGAFLGTTDNLPLELRVNNSRAVRFEPGPSSTVSVMAGSPSNRLDDSIGGTIAGGGGVGLGTRPNSIFSSDWSAIGGGRDNIITNGDHVVITGGAGNRNVGLFGSFIGGGSGNQVGGTNRATTGGSGTGNNNSIVGGAFNFIGQNAGSCVIGGGDGNSIGNRTSFIYYATVPGGFGNEANGYASFAAGFHAKANQSGTFVWADSIDADFASTAANQYLIRASGGVGIGTTSPTREVEIQHAGDTELGLKSADTGGHLWTIQSTGVTGDVNRDGSLQIIDRTLNVARLLIGTNGFVGIGTSNPTNRLHVNGGVSATVFVTTSDRHAKENFAPVSSRDILEKVIALPVTQWSFKELPGATHIGPMAQDFYTAFKVGSGSTGIATVDADGVALAAIQGLNQKLTEELKRRDTDNVELKLRLDALEKVIRHQNPNLH